MVDPNTVLAEIYELIAKDVAACKADGRGAFSDEQRETLVAYATVLQRQQRHSRVSARQERFRMNKDVASLDLTELEGMVAGDLGRGQANGRTSGAGSPPSA